MTPKMRPVIGLAPKQINSDRLAPGITASAVGGVEVNASCDYRSPFPGAGVAPMLLLRYVPVPPWAEAYTRPVTQRRRGEVRMPLLRLHAFETRVKT